MFLFMLFFVIFIGGMVFAALDQVPSDLHINAIVLGVLSFFVGLLMLIDLSDPMARLRSDTTQTDNTSISGQVHSAPDQETKTSHAPVKPTVVTINGTLPNEDLDNQSVPKLSNTNMFVNTSEHLGEQSRGHVVEHYSQDDRTSQSDQFNNMGRNGQYHRNADEIDFVHAKVLPSAQQPVFEQILLPEKKRPTWKVIQDPSASNSRMEYAQSSSGPPEYVHGGYAQEPYRRSQRQYHNSAYNYDYSPPKTPEIDRRNRYSYDGKRLMVIRDYSKSARTASSTMASNRSHDTARYSGRSRSTQNCRYNEDDEAIYDKRTAAMSAVQPGFVANAARIWDKRAKQTDDLNTIV